MYDTIFKSVNAKFNTLIKRTKLFHDVINTLYLSYDQGVIHISNIKLNSSAYLIQSLIKPLLIRLSTTSFSNSVNITLAKTGLSGKPINTPSICL